MNYLVVLACFCMAASSNADLDRNRIRQEILLYKLSLTDGIIDPYFTKEIAKRRKRRQAEPFPSDDEDIDFYGSGESVVTVTPTEASTHVPRPPVISPTDWAWYRSKINFLDSIQYTVDLQNYSTPAFAKVAHDVMIAVEDYLKTQFDGYHEATPLMFSMNDDGDVIVLIDVGMCMTYGITDVTQAMLRLVQSGRIGRFRVTEQGFGIRQIGIDSLRRECKPGPTLPPTSSTSYPDQTETEPVPPDVRTTTTTTTTTLVPDVPGCRADQATCNNFQCIDRSYVCDGTPDCLDGSDEPDTCDSAAQCDPTEFLCVGTGVCAQKIWRCDGDNDCGNGYDEQNCPTASPNSRCQATHFECRNRLCIPNSYQCDGESDCEDNSDEEGCTPPVIIVPPRRYVTAAQGSTVTLHCEAVGFPKPVISWRVNWGNVPPPPRVTMTTRDGVGTLIIRKVKSSDQGAYTCEAMNPNGSILGTPDGILIVDEDLIPPPETTSVTAAPTKEPEPCPLGEFNYASPDTPIKCKSCFCSGVTDLCYSSRLEYDEIGISFTEPGNDEGVTLEPSDAITGSPDSKQPITENQIRVNPPAKELQLIDLSKRFLAAAHYWSLPAQFLGGKINSYGGTLTYSFSYNNSYHLASAPTSHADVIIEGNGNRLSYRSKVAHPGPVQKHTTSVVLDEDENWKRRDGSTATRGDLMGVLSNLERVLLRTVYDSSMLSTGIGDVTLQVGGFTSSPEGSGFEDHRDTAYTVEECECPEGYQGLSCETCGPGYQRVQAGPHSGKCLSEEQGDSPTVNCPTGYTGPGCTECASGYVRQGDAECRLDAGNHCSVAGTADVDLNGECLCKDATAGAKCDRCRPGYFHLSEEADEGCLSCLCMGVTKSCVSTTWNYTQVFLSHESQRDVKLYSSNARQIFENVILSNPSLDGDERPTLSVTFDNLPNDDAYYWMLTDDFIGNKLSSYGGRLQYTIAFSEGFDLIPLGNRTADVEMSGNGQTLYHYSSETPPPDTDVQYSVGMQEGNWKDSSGAPVTRQQFLIVLSDVERLLVRASYSAYTAVSSIKGLSLDVAAPHVTVGRLADAVEHCDCPIGYVGLSCERCAEGFYRVEGGSYLGTCRPCSCNGHSDVCDGNTGRCQNCRDHTTGDFCQVCQPGYYGNPMAGDALPCRRCPCPHLDGRSDQLDVPTCVMNFEGWPICDRCPVGYIGDRCDRCSPGYVGEPPDTACRLDVPESDCNCDPVGSINGECNPSGQCFCKASTTGRKCDQCKAGFFYMSVDNSDGGCLPCFCMGVTNQCSSSTYKRNEITPDFLDNFGGFTLTSRTLHNTISAGFELTNGDRALSYPRIDRLSGGETYYWKLPEEFTGDKIVSYGGKLQYKVFFTASSTGASNDDPDVILTGNDITIVARSTGSPMVQPNTITDRAVIFKESQWQKEDGEPASREHLLMVLADLEAVLLRATFSTATLRSSISDVVMETASESVLMSEPVYEVEQCDCPNGYHGSSCEDCAAGFTRFGDGIYLGLCHLCQCNGHAELCDAESGTCFNCLHNTAGVHCDRCATGFYGDATRGTEGDCRPCACPGTGDNNFAESCRLDGSTNNLYCSGCREGYTGQRCENCAPGYFGNPTAPGGRCERGSEDVLQVRVSPKTTEVAEGDRVSLRCDVNSSIHVSIQWHRLGSNRERLPSEAVISDGGRLLQLNNFTSSLEGSYVCVARSRHQTLSDLARVSLRRSNPMIKVRVEEPRGLRVRVGSQVSLVCTARSEMPAFLVMWTKRGGRLPMPRATDFEGILHIDNVQLSDAGTYVCTGSNMYGIDTETATLVVVRDEIAMPSVVVSPQNQSVSEGEDALFYCRANGSPDPTVEWTRDDGTPMPNDVHVVGNMLMIPSVSLRDRSRYRCRATNQHGFVEATAALDVVARGRPPRVTVETPDVTITVGDNTELRCTAAAIPQARFAWSKSDELDVRLPDNVHQIDEVLRITSARLDNEGEYSCSASNYFGRDEGRIRVTVNRRVEDGKPICRTEPKEVTAYVGTNSTITCVVGGDPLPEVTWKIDGGMGLDENIKVIDQTMFIHKVRADNAGSYVCVATNQKGTSESRMTLNVVQKDLPRVKILPNAYQRVITGQDASFTCLTPGQTGNDVTWHRSGHNFFSGDTYLSDGNRKINFRNVTIDEAGGYTCIASNEAGYKQVQVNIDVLQPPLITISPSLSIDVVEGKSLSLRCDVFGIPVPSVVWLNSTGAGSPGMLTNYRLRSSVFSIDHVQLSHAGTYYCRATNHAGNAQQRVNITVRPRIVHRPPVTIIRPPFVRGTAGSQIQVECSSEGSPAPTVTWSKAGLAVLPPGTRQLNGTLFVSNLTGESAGVYQCIASNSVGEDMRTVEIQLIEPPSMRIEPETNVFLVDGESANITCVVVAGTLPVAVSWSMNSASAPHLVTRNASVEIRNFSSESDEGTYSCTGVNVAGSTSLTVSVAKLTAPVARVQVNETSVVVGQSVSLACDVTSAQDQSDFVVGWRKEKEANPRNNNSITSSGDHVIIAKVELEDAGTYTCVASNKAGSSSASVLLRVLEPPSVDISIEAVVNQPLVEGSDFTIVCNSTGTPNPIIRLTKDGQELKIKNGRYRVRSASPNDAGNYLCIAGNDAGESRAQKAVAIFKKPIAVIEYSRVQVRSGERLSLRCDGLGRPTPDVTWSRLGKALSNSSVVDSGELEIEEARLTDAGTYLCNATNHISSANASVVVIVDAFLPYFTQTPLSFMTVTVPSNYFFVGFNITVTFRPNALDGLLLYSRSPNSDFISLSLADGVVEFRFELGSGPLTLRSRSPVELERWHTVVITRMQRSGRLQLDGGPVVEGKSPGEFRGLELTNDVFIGGKPGSLDLPPPLQSLGSDCGFYGCISQLDLGLGLIDLGSSIRARESVGITRCKTCGSQTGSSPCHNAATCRETHLAPIGYTCECPPGYVGGNCQFKEAQLCSEDSCSARGSCELNPEAELGFVCKCNRGYEGLRCNKAITSLATTPATAQSLVSAPEPIGHFSPVQELPEPMGLLSHSNRNDSSRSRDHLSASPSRASQKKSDAISFRKNSYAMSTSVRLTQPRRTDVTVRIRRRTNADGMLLYSGGFKQRSPFLSLAFRQHALELRVNTGSDTLLLRAPTSSVGVGSWHTIRVIRRRNRGKLLVDGRTVARARSSGSQTLRLDAPLFIGGLKFWDYVPQKTDIRNGFDGCVDSLRIDDIDISLDELFTKKNTEACGAHSNREASTRRGPTRTTMTRPRYYARFASSSYASFDNTFFDHDQAAEQIRVQFKTTEPFGLILFHGEDIVGALKKVSRLRHRRRGGGRRRAKKKDYISLGVQSSYLVYTFDLGGGKSKATSRFPVSDGQWHTATIVRRGSLALMWMDDMPIPVATQSPQSHSVADTPGRVYIGGAPDVIFATAGRYTSGFNGCIRNVRLTAISNSRASELGSGYLNDSSTPPLDMSRSGTLERINLRRCAKREDN